LNKEKQREKHGEKCTKVAKTIFLKKIAKCFVEEEAVLKKQQKFEEEECCQHKTSRKRPIL
jgi:hypothetical protein